MLKASDFKNLNYFALNSHKKHKKHQYHIIYKLDKIVNSIIYCDHLCTRIDELYSTKYMYGPSKFHMYTESIVKLSKQEINELTKWLTFN